MKKEWAVIIVVLILIFVVVLFIFGNQGNEYQINNEELEEAQEIDGLTSEQVLEFIKPEIDVYCENLKSQVEHSACPTCQYYYPNDKDEAYIKVSQQDYDGVNRPLYQRHIYVVNEEGDNYRLNINMALIYGSNTRGGSVTFEFLVDQEGNILEKSMPEKQCKG